ncbi:MAG: ThiF family adenylyltransferase, partial [Ignavibacteria bacterium]|nr:ThiF family adenylyltransferase [Ignavibacteria bacterium]
MKNYSAILTERIHKQLCDHLIRADGQEDLCFATYIPSTGKERFTGIISRIILPGESERSVHGNAEFYPEYLIRSAKIAAERKEGLVFLHSHPFPGWQGMSYPDEIAEKRISSIAFAMTNLPLLGLTSGNDELWSARFWTKDEKIKRTYHRKWCISVRVIGEKLSVTFNDKLLKPKSDIRNQIRTISSWGQKTQDDISRLKIGIVGLGSVGSIVAEILSRTGVADFILIDFDSVEAKNQDRTQGVYQSDIGKAKVKVIAESIKNSSPIANIFVEPIEYSVCEEDGYRAALDCDILFSCVDRPWARQVLNFISYAHLIPVIDGGIKVRTNSSNTKLLGATWRTHTVGYKRTCLECLGQFKSEHAKVESEGLLDDPAYIKGMTDKSFIHSGENVYALSSHVASMEVLQFLSLFISPGGVSDIGQQIYQMSLGILERDDKICHPNCFYPSIVGKGDYSEVKIYGKHEIAEIKRNERNIKIKKV